MYLVFSCIALRVSKLQLWMPATIYCLTNVDVTRGSYVHRLEAQMPPALAQELHELLIHSEMQTIWVDVQQLG